MSLVRTGVGSLPHDDCAAAVAFVQATTDVPYLPQLPNRNIQESMLAQWGAGVAVAGGQGSRNQIGGAEGGDRDEAFSGAAAMLAHLDGPVVKTQATGPVTLAAALRASGDQTPGLMNRVVAELEGRIRAHIEWIKREAAVERVVLVLDEPTLSAVGIGALPEIARHALTRLISSVDAEIGLHCCGDTDWGALAGLGFDWLSWDLAALGEGFLAGVDPIARALGAGTRVMWGIVPTTTGPLPEQHVLVGRYGTAIANLVVAGAPFEMLKSRAWFTPACGLAGLSVGDAEAVTSVLADVVEEVDSGW